MSDRLRAALADRYRIERELGQGGMATVYLAEDLKHERRVALKVLKPELAAVLGADRFIQEIKTTAALQHPHILPLFDSGAADGFLYYVMPFIDGETLRSTLDRETQLGIDESVRLTTAVADALDYAHRHGVIHRDIKPENILLHDGRPMVADFGIALALSAAAGGRMTETGLSLGTPHYMSPEQATAEKELTNRSDIYSLGAVLYEMLAGNPPHVGASVQQIIMKIVTDPARPVTELRKSVPANVAAAVGKALEKIPADRFATAKAFADALGNPSFSAETAGIRAGGAPRRGRVVSFGAFATAATLAALAGIAAAWGWIRPQAEQPVSRFNIVLPDSQPMRAAPGAGTRIALSTDGRVMVYASQGGPGIRSMLYLRRFDQLGVLPLPGTEDAYNPAFSPDGKSVAFVSGGRRALKVVSLAGGNPVLLTDSLVDQGGVTWSPDGYIYYDGHFEGDGLARIKAAGGIPEIATRPADASESWHATPWALPNGRGVLFTIARGRGAQPFDIGVLDLRTGKHHVLVRGAAPRYADSGHLLYSTEDGTMMAIRFDPERLTTSGDPVAIGSGLAMWGLARADLDISRTGLLVYATGSAVNRERQLVWVGRDGTAEDVDSAWSGELMLIPSLSPDGHRALMAVLRGSHSELWVKELDRGAAGKLADLGTAPAWSPDGRDVVFYGSGGVYTGPADGRVLAQMKFPSTDLIYDLAYSPDGRWLIGTRAGDILGFPLTGDSTPVVLIGGGALDRHGTISPDGHWLAYESDESGRPQVSVRPFPDTKTAKHQISVEGGSWPRWSRDGRELFFLNEFRDLVAVPVSGAPTFSFGTPRRLFSASQFILPQVSFSVHPDGRRFLMTRNRGGAAPIADRVVVVQNVFEELKARVH